MSGAYSSHSINIRNAHADFLKLLAESASCDLSTITRNVIDAQLGLAADDDDFLQAIDLESHRKQLKRLHKRSTDRRAWTSLDIELREDQVLALTGIAREQRSSLSRVLRHEVAAYLGSLAAPGQGAVTLSSRLPSLPQLPSLRTVGIALAGLALLMVLAVGGWWVVNNKDRFTDDSADQGEIVIDSLEALEELERRNREAAEKRAE